MRFFLIFAAFVFHSCKFQPQPPAPVCPCPCDTVVVVPPKPDTTTHGFLLGVNSNWWQAKEQQAKMQGIRLYAPTGWLWTEKGFYGQPILQGQKQFNGLDDYLIYMKSKGVDVLLCLHKSPDFLNGHTEGWRVNEWPPVRPGADKNERKSYEEVAGIYKAFAIRYGDKRWPVGSYKVDNSPPRWNGDPPQEYKSGLNLIEWIEVDNEKDRWWQPEAAMSPEQYGAMLLTCYDSIKAYSNLKVAMMGLTGADLNYLKKMNAWCMSVGRKFPADCINIHRYSSSGNLPGVHPPSWPLNSGVPFNLDKGFNDVALIVQWAKSIGLPVWVSEYGYDTQPGSQVYPYALANGKTAEQTQAEWLVSATLEYRRLGVERCYIFTISDEPNPSGGTFNSCGLLKGENFGYAEKPAMAAIADLCAALKAKKLVFSLQ